MSRFIKSAALGIMAIGAAILATPEKAEARGWHGGGHWGGGHHWGYGHHRHWGYGYRHRPYYAYGYGYGYGGYRGCYRNYYGYRICRW